uniref:Uncharacterized protein n=1 Tax=Anguilla anguilla TaxID=7936 RepID=A0A0E9UVQ3_ANGAN
MSLPSQPYHWPAGHRQQYSNCLFGFPLDVAKAIGLISGNIPKTLL